MKHCHKSFVTACHVKAPQLVIITTNDKFIVVRLCHEPTKVHRYDVIFEAKAVIN